MGEAVQTAQMNDKSGITSGHDLIQTVQTAVVSQTGVILIRGLRLVTQAKWACQRRNLGMKTVR